MTLLLIARATAADPLRHFDAPEWQTYSRTAPPLSLRLPYRFELRPGTARHEVFKAYYRNPVPSISLRLVPGARDLRQSLQSLMAEYGPGTDIVYQEEKPVHGVPALIAYLRWRTANGTELQSMVLCASAGDRIVLLEAIDGAPHTGFDARLAESLLSLRLGARDPTADTGESAPADR